MTKIFSQIGFAFLLLSVPEDLSAGILDPDLYDQNLEFSTRFMEKISDKLTKEIREKIISEKKPENKTLKAFLCVQNKQSPYFVKGFKKFHLYDKEVVYSTLLIDENSKLSILIPKDLMDDFCTMIETKLQDQYTNIGQWIEDKIIPEGCKKEGENLFSMEPYYRVFCQKNTGHSVLIGLL